MIKSLQHYGNNAVMAFFILFVFWPLSQFIVDIFKIAINHVALSMYCMATVFLVPSIRRLYGRHSNMFHLAIILLVWIIFIGVAGYSKLVVVQHELALKTIGIDFGLPILYFFLGYFHKGIVSDRRFPIFVTFLCVVYLALGLYAWGKYDGPSYLLRSRVATEGIIYSYQTIGDTLAVLGIGLFVNLSSSRITGIVSILLVMLFLGSTGAMGAFVVFILFRLTGRLKYRTLAVLLVLVSAAIVVFWNTLIISPNSILTRFELMHYRLDHLPNLIWGSYHIEIYEARQGHYIHNILSFIEQYGLIFFGAYMVLFINLLYRCKGLSRKREIAEYAFYCLVYSFVILALIRSCFNPIPWFAIGLAVMATEQRESIDT